MSKKAFVIFYLISSGFLICDAQSISSGRIEFERVIHLPPQSDALTYQERLKRENIFYKRDTFVLTFNDSASVYQLKASNGSFGFFNIPAQKNIVYQDFKNNIRVSGKEIFDELYSVKDSGAFVKWKYSSDVREIAGHECRRAETILFDSVFVVAFYAIDIIGSSGPESFHGLPGMILGVAVPRLNTTWFASKVEKHEGGLPRFNLPNKSISIDLHELRKSFEIEKTNWGMNGNRYLIWSII